MCFCIVILQKTFTVQGELQKFCTFKLYGNWWYGIQALYDWSNAFRFEFITLVVNAMQGCGLGNKMCHRLQPKETKVTLNWPLIL